MSLRKPISALLRPGNANLFEEMLQQWRTVGNTVSGLTGPRFEPQIFRSGDERVTARPTKAVLFDLFLRGIPFLILQQPCILFK